MEDSEMFANQNNARDGDDACFRKSLQELRDLRSQLHYAADYCESAFLHARHKKVVIYNTKEYVSKAVVTVVDHLGNVSSKLDSKLSHEKDSNSDTEFRVKSLNQKLSTCKEYANKLALSAVKWNPHHPRYYPRYGSYSNHSELTIYPSDIPYIERPLKDLPVDDPTMDGMAIVLLKYKPKPNSARSLEHEENAMVRDKIKKPSAKVPCVGGIFSTARKTPSNIFHFQDSDEPERPTLMKRTMQALDKFPFVCGPKQPP